MFSSRILYLSAGLIGGEYFGHTLNKRAQKFSTVTAQDDEYIPPDSFVHSIGIPKDGYKKAFKNFEAYFDYEHRIAAWVCERITKDSFTYERGRGHFFCPPDIPRMFQVTFDDYSISRGPTRDERAIDKGHLVAKGNHNTDEEAYQETFNLMNIAPQYHIFNTDLWQHLERHIRNIVLNDPKNKPLYVFTGPVFAFINPPDEGGRNTNGTNYVKYQLIGNGDEKKIAIPKFFFKCYCTDDDDTPLTCYLLAHKAEQKTFHQSNCTDRLDFIVPYAGIWIERCRQRT